jgi:hypothetical protein
VNEVSQSSRLQRLQQLQQATHDYVGKEQTRIDNEVSSLQAILNGRTAGAGVQQSSNQVVQAVAQSDLTAYLGS